MDTLKNSPRSHMSSMSWKQINLLCCEYRITLPINNRSVLLILIVLWVKHKRLLWIRLTGSNMLLDILVSTGLLLEQSKNWEYGYWETDFQWEEEENLMKCEILIVQLEYDHPSVSFTTKHSLSVNMWLC